MGSRAGDRRDAGARIAGGCGAERSKRDSGPCRGSGFGSAVGTSPPHRRAGAAGAIWNERRAPGTGQDYADDASARYAVTNTGGSVRG